MSFGNIKKFCSLLILYTIILQRSLFGDQNQSCLILLDQRDTENIGRTSTFYLTTKLQSAIGEKSVPILVHTSLWNSFIERRAYFDQNSDQENTQEQKVLKLYDDIKNKIIFWSHRYNEANEDIIQNKSLVAQRINEEFYNSSNDVPDLDYQLLLNYLTTFDLKDWFIYKKCGFYLFIPKNYYSNNFNPGFKTDNLERVETCEDIALNYFGAQELFSLSEVLPLFFRTRDEVNDQTTPYKWNIVISGHGGYSYTEEEVEKKINCKGEPIIADLSLQEFKKILDFFQNQINTHMLHYSSCYAGGNHIELAFEKKYNYAIICECLTDCVTYCKWTNTLPSKQKRFLSVDDLHYDSTTKSWDLNMKSPYNWQKFFNSISKIDFSFETIGYLPNTLAYITYPIIANISLLRRPEASQFYPLTSKDTIKVDEFIFEDEESKVKNDVFINDAKTLLITSCINCNLTLNNAESLRIISISPGKAQHYIRKLVLKNPVDLPSIFWQAEFQIYDKTFLIDECQFSFLKPLLTFESLKFKTDFANISKLLIIQKSNFFGQFLRLFFTIEDKTFMLVAKKSDPYQLDESTTIQEVIELSSEAKLKYEKVYNELKISVERKRKEKHSGY